MNESVRTQEMALGNIAAKAVRAVCLPCMIASVFVMQTASCPHGREKVSRLL